MKLLLIRMMGLGDVASILVPAAKLYRKQFPQCELSVLTYQAGSELMQLVPEVDHVIGVTESQWPNEIMPAIISFLDIAETIARENFDYVVNLDTWFMPCLLARVLKDSGVRLDGNFLSMSVEDLLGHLTGGTLKEEYVETPGQYVSSTFPNMKDWFVPWWERSYKVAYPNFYLNNCCGLIGDVDISIPCEADEEILNAAQGRKIIAVSATGRARNKNYKDATKLVSALEKRGYYVWSQFDGSVPMRKTLNRLKSTDLLVTVPTSTQWLARLAGCPSLMIPGPMPPSVLGAEYNVPQLIDCQYCFQGTYCPRFDEARCLDVPVGDLVAQIDGILAPAS